MTESLRSPLCRFILPGPKQTVFNRSRKPSGDGEFEVGPCSSFKDLLVFVKSKRGQHYYLGERRWVSYYQPEGDPYRPGQSFSAFGRYALFRVLNPTPGARIQMELTNTLEGDRSNKLPPVSVVGTTRTQLPTVGRGAARVVSKPVRPRMINGAPYLMVDMGVRGRTPPTQLDGLSNLYGKHIAIDNRFLTTRVRDLSLVPASEYRRGRPPTALSEFPTALANPRVEFSGIYDDGWVGEDSYVVLEHPRGSDLRVAGDVPPHVGEQRVEVLVDGRRVARRELGPGPFEITVPAGTAKSRQRIALRFERAAPLAAPDGRPVAAVLTFLGFTPRKEG